MDKELAEEIGALIDQRTAERDEARGVARLFLEWLIGDDTGSDQLPYIIQANPWLKRQETARE